MRDDILLIIPTEMKQPKDQSREKNMHGDNYSLLAV
jgi:hypothetical protein